MRDKSVLITGGYTALGMALSRGFANAGANLGLIARTPEKLEAACAELRGMGVQAVPLVADITNEGQVIGAFRQAKESFGSIDTLVNNTGIPGAITAMADMELSEWEQVISVNLTGTMLCSREAVRHMAPQGGGTIINIGSSAGKRGVPYSSAYSASKWGMVGLTQALAQEVGRQGIRVNCIALGTVEGPRTEWQIERRSAAAGVPEETMRQQRLSGTSLGRMVRQSELASLAVFLASEASDGMTGQAINLTAGGSFS